jgi:hypothetical protein
LVTSFAAGAIPESLENLVNLMALGLSENKLEGKFFSFFGLIGPDWPSDFSFNFAQGTSPSPWETL